MVRPSLVTIFLMVLITLSWSNNFDNTGNVVTYYPSSLMLAIIPKPIFFFSDTQLLHLNLDLIVELPGSSPTIQYQCSKQQQNFMIKLLRSLADTTVNIRRLLSLPGFTNLIECSSYLKRSYKFYARLPAKMRCPRFFRTSLSECKRYALRACVHLSVNEKLWLQRTTRSRRSNVACHMGLFGIPRAIYTATGGSCQSNHIAGLKTVLRDMASAINADAALIRTVFGKTVHMMRMTDQLTTKVNSLTQNIKDIDYTLAEWSVQISKFMRDTNCYQNANMDFLSKFSFQINRITQLLLRLIEVQDIVTQFAHLRNRALISFNDLPQSVISAVSHHFKKLPGMSLTAQALDAGFPLLMNPITEYSHSPKRIVLTTLVTVPRMVSENSLCTVETLVPLKYQIRDKCFTGPLARQDLVLVSCKHKQFVLKADVLTACFSQPNTHICPHSVLRDANNTSWIGLPWVADTKLNYDRNHIYTTCGDSDTLHHLGGRYYLSTTTQNIELSKGTLQMTPLSIYHIPCNETNPKLKSGFGNCPEILKVSIPIFQEQSVNYIPWIPPHMDPAYELHYKSLNISPPLKFNKSIINAFDKTFIRLDGQLQKKMKLIYSEIDAIKETQETETAFIIGCIALSLAGLNSFFLIAFCCCFNKVSKFIAGPSDAVSHFAARFTKSPPNPVPPKQPDAHHNHPNCAGCNRPLDGNTPLQLTVSPSDDESSIASNEQ